jgi:SAM-dependent methyltransferase
VKRAVNDIMAALSDRGSGSEGDETQPESASWAVPRETGHEAPALLRAVRDDLRRGEDVSDRAFDEVYPFHVRHASRTHWTPVDVARRASELLVERPGARILDVGSGVGKFCIIAAASFDARVRGVEHRGYLVDIARLAASKLGVDVAFECRAVAAFDASDVDGVYLFNPFAENLCPSKEQVDGLVELSEARFRRDVAATVELLRSARVGTRVVTYCGFGGEMPASYAPMLREQFDGALELWVKTEP